MAERLNKRHQESTRKKIQVSQLINRLENHVLKAAKMETSQVRAACYLISQAIGNPPQSHQHTGEEGGPIAFTRIERLIVDPPAPAAKPAPTDASAE